MRAISHCACCCCRLAYQKHVVTSKTTTLQILTGLVPPSDGSASVCGFDIKDDMEQIKRFIGVCPQEDKLYEDLSVRQHLVFYSLLRGLPRSRIDVEARRLAEKVGLDGDAFNKAASTLSGGAKRRLSIAIALAGKPPVLFFGTCKPLPLRLLPKVQQWVRRRADDGIAFC